jgi:transposase
MTLVGETDLQLLEPNLADVTWMYRPDKRLRILRYATDHLTTLRSKIAPLRAEIAQLQELNDRYWLRGRNYTLEQVARGQGNEGLQEIQQELSQLADLGREFVLWNRSRSSAGLSRIKRSANRTPLSGTD